jgi:hypothetical protein
MYPSGTGHLRKAEAGLTILEAASSTPIALPANKLQRTPPRPMRVEDPRQDMDRLFHELVSGPHRKQNGTSFRRYLDEKLSAPANESKVQKDIPVIVPILGRHTDIKALDGLAAEDVLESCTNMVRGARGASQVPQSPARCMFAVGLVSSCGALRLTVVVRRW